MKIILIDYTNFGVLYTSDYSFKPTLRTDKDYTDWYNNTIKSYRSIITKDMKLD